MLKQLD